VINFTPRLLYSQERIPVPLKQKNEWGPESVWTVFGEKKNILPCPGFEYRTIQPVLMIKANEMHYFTNLF
jgi:hypothetical protein